MKRIMLPMVILAGLAAACAPVPRPQSPPPPPTRAVDPPSTSDRKPEPSRDSPRTPAAPREPEISVGLAWDLDSLSIDPVGAAEVTLHDTRTLEGAARLDIALKRGGAVARAVRASGGSAGEQSGSWAIARGDTLRIEGRDGPADGPARLVRWNGRSWRGRFQVFLNPRGKLTVTTVLPLERYLLGVIPAEIGALAAELIEAGRAQTIAARSYTLFYKGRRGSEGFDLYGTVEDQVYGPVDAERPLASRCVESTRGEIAAWRGAPIRANYSSTCGGISSEVWEAWSTPPLDYLVSHLDRHSGAADFCAASPHYRWLEEWAPAELASNLTRFAPAQGVPLPAGGVGEIVDVEVRSRSRSGRVWRLAVITSTGVIEIPAYALRQVLRRPGNPNAILRSNLFKTDVRRDPRTRRILSIVVSGAGSGHGVGLCQTGALGMARAGKTGEAMLEHYYPGVELERLY